MSEPATDEVAALDLHDVTSAQLAIYSEIEHCAVAQPMFAVKPEPNGPDLLRLQRALGANHPAHVPRAPIFGRRIVL